MSGRSLLARSRLGVVPRVEVLNFAAKLGLVTEGEKRGTLLVVIFKVSGTQLLGTSTLPLRTVPCTQLTFAKLLIVKGKQ